MSTNSPAGIPDGTRFVGPAAVARRRVTLAALRSLYASWGYVPVEVPALERYDPQHPRAEQAFKLTDRDGGVLALRTDFTPALARWVKGVGHDSSAAGALRLSYDGPVWHFIDPELARVREFTQVGIELVGVSNARADAELIHLARESVRAVGLRPQVEVGNPAYVRALLDAAEVPPEREAEVADAIDRKDRSDLGALIAELGTRGPGADALLATADLYGDPAVLAAAKAAAPTPAARAALRRLQGVIEEFEDLSELQLDLGMARRLSYYTGVTFRVYTADFGQPLLGGGRYDGSLLQYAAGFSLGLERLLAAAEARSGEGARAGDPIVHALDDALAREVRRAGFSVVRSLAPDRATAEREARAAGASYLLVAGEVVALGEGSAEDGAPASVDDLIRRLLVGARGDPSATTSDQGEGPE